MRARPSNWRSDTASSHQLRHAYGRRCVDLGVDIRVIAEALGHESLESTRLYTQMSVQRTRQIAELFSAPGG